jgi:uncharacterized protein (TIGR02453 family)
MPRPLRQPPEDISGVPPARFEGFSSETFRFLHGLRKNNNKAWFEAHRDAYEEYLREPSKELAEVMGQLFRDHEMPVVGNAKTSLFRINRDIRFSKDKSPYKTHIGLSFPLEGSKKEEWCGFYFSFEPAEKGKGIRTFAGGGVYMPMPDQLKRIRTKIAAEHKQLEKILSDKPFKKLCPNGLTGDTLTRMPKGFDEDHPAAKWLKMKSFLFEFPLSEEDLISKKLPDRLLKNFQISLPLIAFFGNA